MLGFINTKISLLNNSKFFAGVVMILLNIGSKYVTVSLSKSQEAYIRNYVARELIIFAIAWMGTRDIYMALFLTATFIVLTQHLFNEESSLCVLPQQYKVFHLVDKNSDGIVSQKEIDEATELLKLASDQKSIQEKQRVFNYFSQTKM
jgi:hypothetical protein